MGGDLDSEQRKPHQPRQVRRTHTHADVQQISVCHFNQHSVGSSFCVLSQEGVSLGKYSPLEVSVETDKGLMLCRTYQMNNFHACAPSPQYKQVCGCKHVTLVFLVLHILGLK